MGSLALLLAAMGALAAALAVGLRRQRAETARLWRRLELATADLERLETAFRRFAPEPVVEEIAAKGIPARGERKEVTALFADLVGFTQLSESVEPSVLVRILNGYFARMSLAITDHRGHVSTFLGDGVLAFYGAFEPNPWQSDDAVHSALAMREAIREYSAELGREGLPTLSVGVGVHRGVGVAGLVGSPDKMEFAVVGRTVNLAARVQELTRVHGVDILVTRAVRDVLDRRFALEPRAALPVKGVADPVEVFFVAGIREGSAAGPATNGSGARIS